MKRLALWILVASLMGWTTLAEAAGTFTAYSTTWNGLPRAYAVYVPTSLPAGSPMVLHLHATAMGQNTLPYQLVPQWEALAQQNSFLMVWPISTYNTRSASWYWEDYFMDFSFPNPPDDVGFLRNLIVTLSSQYSTNPNAVFVSGMSSGALMAQRMGVEASDLVAAIAPVSGQTQIKQITSCFTPGPPLAPVSVLEIHGDADTTLPYCGGPMKTIWGESGLALATVDQDMGYWVSANSCSNRSTSQALCTNGVPTAGVNGFDATGCSGGVEVQFVRQLGAGHVWGQGTEKVVWQFFAGHRKQ